MPEAEQRKERVMEFLSAFERKDVEACLQFLAKDAMVKFGAAKYKGEGEIRGWLQERFDVNLHIVKLRSVVVKGDRVKVKARVSSDRIRDWPARGISGMVIIDFEDGAFKKVKFGLLCVHR